MMATTTPQRRRIRRLGSLLAAFAALMASLGASAPAASAAPEWDAVMQWAPTVLKPGERGGVRLEVLNVGDQTAEAWPAVEVDLPEGVEFSEGDTAGGLGWQCSATGTPETVTCANPFIPFLEFLWPKAHTHIGMSIFPIWAQFTVEVAPDAPIGLHPMTARLSGAGAPGTATIEEHVRIGDDEPSFGIVEGTFGARALDEAGDPAIQAGAHPHEVVVELDTKKKFNDPAADGTWLEMIEPVANIKDTVTDLPTGFSGDALATPPCTLSAVASWSCPPESQVGVAFIEQIGVPSIDAAAVHNVVPSKGAPAQFAFKIAAEVVLLRPMLRSDGDWGVRTIIKDNSEANPVFRIEVRLWGVPADARHDALRCERPSSAGPTCAGYDTGGQRGLGEGHDPHSSSAPPRPLLSLPTECDGQAETTSLYMSSWLDPAPFTADGDPDLSSPKWIGASDQTPALEGCEALEFAPTLKARPTTNAADSPSGLDVDLHIPQNLDPDGLATAHLRDVTVTLPEGLVVNPSGINGLSSCSEDQANLDTRFPDDCPEQAKIGDVVVETPVLSAPLSGAVYVATPHDNPSGSLVAIYVTIDDEGTGIVGKIPGRVIPDPQTGRLTATFERNPQLPYEDFRLDFFGGATAVLKTPATCGAYTTSSRLTSYADPLNPVVSDDTWQIVNGPNGASCPSSEAQLPNSPTFKAGSSSPIAGAHSPFVIELSRADGTQRFRSLTVTPPKGLLATLAGTVNCPDSALAAAARKDGRDEQASPSCPAASRVGTAVAAGGAGPAPYYAPGTVYLAGPYKGAPISLAIVTPAVAGPYDLGTIVFRTALHLDPRTAQITSVSDEIPAILEGIPLNVRSASVRLDRPNFSLNPTSCEESTVGGSLLSTLGQSVSLSERFQVAECHRLGFKPRLKLNLKGGHRRGDYQRLRAELRMPAGNANIAHASVSLPSAFFLAQEHLSNICTRVQFAADQCPKASVYGTVKATTPLLDEPLTGPVYLRSSNNTLPDLVAALKGPEGRPIEVELVGRTDSKGNGIRNTFDLVPDAPVSKFVLRLRGGSHSLIVNSTNICRNPQRATARFKAHNGRTRTIRPVMKTRCGKGTRRGAKKRRG